VDSAIETDAQGGAVASAPEDKKVYHSTDLTLPVEGGDIEKVSTLGRYVFCRP
jgi:hypothetical protein